MIRFACLFFTLALLLRASQPDQSAALFRRALAGFGGETPAGWAYTLTTRKGGDTSVERFDPSRPVGQQWTLLLSNGRAPTAEETHRYRSYKTTHTPSTVRSTFGRGDLDLATARFVQEDGLRADYLCQFRPDLDDGTLANLEVLFTVNQAATPYIERYELRLREPFSPVLSVKITELNVIVTFSAPTPEAPALPAASNSRFRGRVLFFKSIEEDLSIAYSDFHRTAPPGRRTE